MPLPWFVQQPARYYVHKPYERLFRGFSSTTGGQDPLSWFEGGRKRSHASASATCCTQM